MKAAILYGREQVRIEEIQPAALKPGEVRITIEAALTCGTDLKVFKRGYHAKMIVPPAVFGHELAGVIGEASPEAKGWKAGDRVTVANSAPCGRCFHCRHQQENLCDDLLFINGAYAESIVIPERIVQKNLLHLKPETAFCDAALVEPLACVVGGIEDLRLQPNEHVLILGAGPIGLMFTALARHLGCAVTVAGRGESRLQTARRLGAAQVIHVQDKTDLVTAVRPASHGLFDVVIEAVGKPEIWAAAVQLVRKGGRVNFFGGCPSGTRVSLDTALLHYSNLTLLASFHHTPQAVRRALEYIEAGLIHAGDFVTSDCALSQLPQLFQRMATGNHAVKTLIRVHE